MAKLGIYLAYDNANEALKYYKENFGAVIVSQEPVTIEMNEMFKLDPTTLDNSTFSAIFEIDGVMFNCSDKVDHNGPFNDSFNPMILYTKVEENFFNSLIDKVRNSNSKVIYEELNLDNDFQMFRFIDPFNITWSLIME